MCPWIYTCNGKKQICCWRYWKVIWTPSCATGSKWTSLRRGMDKKILEGLFPFQTFCGPAILFFYSKAIIQDGCLLMASCCGAYEQFSSMFIQFLRSKKFSLYFFWFSFWDLLWKVYCFTVSSSVCSRLEHWAQWQKLNIPTFNNFMKDFNL